MPRRSHFSCNAMGLLLHVFAPVLMAYLSDPSRLLCFMFDLIGDGFGERLDDQTAKFDHQRLNHRGRATEETDRAQTMATTDHKGAGSAVCCVV